VAMSFYDGGDHPLTTLAWPQNRAEAQMMPLLPHDFVRCVDCGHVYNSKFDYADVPYSDKPNLMFNRGSIWSEHLESVRRIISENLPPNPTVVEIGCGDGHLLRALAESIGSGRFIGFDPNADINDADGLIEGRPMLFDPAEHIDSIKPDLLISRHVLEHLLNPLGFVQALGFAASWAGTPTQLFIEVPCIDRVFAQTRTVDFFYEHNSHFTMKSLHRMLDRCATNVRLVDTSYNGEVLYALADFGVREEQIAFAQQALQFRAETKISRVRLRRQIDDLANSGQSVAIWGGTGKAAAFIHQNGMDADRFPIVVDSDATRRVRLSPERARRFVLPSFFSTIRSTWC
jgi:hypothetical protein